MPERALTVRLDQADHDLLTDLAAHLQQEKGVHVSTSDTVRLAIRTMADGYGLKRSEGKRPIVGPRFKNRTAGVRS